MYITLSVDIISAKATPMISSRDDKHCQGVLFLNMYVTRIIGKIVASSRIFNAVCPKLVALSSVGQSL